VTEKKGYTLYSIPYKGGKGESLKHNYLVENPRKGLEFEDRKVYNPGLDRDVFGAKYVYTFDENTVVKAGGLIGTFSDLENAFFPNPLLDVIKSNEPEENHPERERKKRQMEQERAEKEKSRIHSYSNTAATAALPEEMLKLIYKFLPEGVRDTAERGTEKEREAKFFKTKFPATKKGAEDLLYELIQLSDSPYVEGEHERVMNTLTDLAEGMSDAKFDRLQEKLMTKASDMVKKHDLKKILDLLKTGSTTKEIVDFLT
jgi:hypothetical protein